MCALNTGQSYSEVRLLIGRILYYLAAYKLLLLAPLITIEITLGLQSFDCGAGHYILADYVLLLGGKCGTYNRLDYLHYNKLTFAFPRREANILFPSWPIGSSIFSTSINHFSIPFFQQFFIFFCKQVF
jgi:hypothetical protein